MGYRQYIGARYVPRFDGPWDATKNYEPLTVVEDGNGNSYTSKKDVPKGTPLNNREYWMLTASFSGAVEQLRRDVVGLQTDVSDMQTAVADLETKDVAIQAEIDTIKQTINATQKILIVSDSYGSYNNSSGENFAAIIQRTTGIPAEQVALGSAGFGAAVKLTTALDSYAGNRSEITDIVVIAGANDIAGSVTAEAILSGAAQFKAKVESDFPNVTEIALFACGISYNAGFTVENRQKMILAYKQITVGDTLFTFVNNSQYVLFDRRNLSDNVHPSARGVDQIAWYASNYIKDGAIDVLNATAYSATAVTGVTLLPGMSGGNQVQHNGMVRVSGRGFQPFIGFQFDTPIGINAAGLTTLQTVANISPVFVDQQSVNNDFFVMMPCILEHGDASRSVGRCTFKIDGGVVYAQMMSSVVKTISKVTPMGAYEFFAAY